MHWCFWNEDGCHLLRGANLETLMLLNGMISPFVSLRGYGSNAAETTLLGRTGHKKQWNCKWVIFFAYNLKVAFIIHWINYFVYQIIICNLVCLMENFGPSLLYHRRETRGPQFQISWLCQRWITLLQGLMLVWSSKVILRVIDQSGSVEDWNKKCCHSFT